MSRRMSTRRSVLGIGATVLLLASACAEQDAGDPTKAEVGLLPWSESRVQAPSPAVNKIAFLGGSAGDEVWLMNPDGTGLEPLTGRVVGGGWWCPLTWSADGRKLAFVRRDDIHTKNVDGTGLVRNLTRGGVQPHVECLSWSPDGTRIAFATDERPVSGEDRGLFTIFVMNADGTDVRSIQGPDGPWTVGTDLSWSPDGAEVVFFGWREGRPSWEHGWYAVDVESGDARELVAPPLPRGWHVVEGSTPVFSPDGEKMAFSAYRPVQGRPAVSGIFVMNADGSGLDRLTRHRRAVLAPSWSPDGTRIVFARDGRSFVMNADGSEVTRLGLRGVSPVWSPVSRP